MLTDKRNRKSQIEKLDPKVFQDLIGYVTKHRGVPVTTQYKEFFKRYPHLKITEKMFRDWYAKWETNLQGEVNRIMNTLPAEIAGQGLEMGVLLKELDQLVVVAANAGMRQEWEDAKKSGRIDTKQVMDWFFRLSRLKLSQGMLAHKLERDNRADEMMQKLLNRSRFGVIDQSEIVKMAEYESEQDIGGSDPGAEGTEPTEAEGVSSDDRVAAEG